MDIRLKSRFSFVMVQTLVWLQKDEEYVAPTFDH